MFLQYQWVVLVPLGKPTQSLKSSNPVLKRKVSAFGLVLLWLSRASGVIKIEGLAPSSDETVKTLFKTPPRKATSDMTTSSSAEPINIQSLLSQVYAMHHVGQDQTYHMGTWPYEVYLRTLSFCDPHYTACSSITLMCASHLIAIPKIVVMYVFPIAIRETPQMDCSKSSLQWPQAGFLFSLFSSQKNLTT